MKIIRVDKNDKALGLISKEKAHQGKGVLHRAFSIFVVNYGGRILLQKRSRKKKLWPLFWTNTCCSHPGKGETYLQAGARRLREEMGFSCRLRPLYQFQYQANYQDIGSENELVTVLLGKYKGEKIKPDKNEVADWSWLSLDELRKEIRQRPESFTPWFKKIVSDKRLKI